MDEKRTKDLEKRNKAKQEKPNKKPMIHPQIYFYPHTIQKEFPYQIGNLCQISFYNTDKHLFDKYKMIYTELEAFLLDSVENVETEQLIDIDFKDTISKNYIQYKLEGLKKLFDWLNKQWSFGMKKMNSLTITYGRYPLITILFSYVDDRTVDDDIIDDDDGYMNRYDFYDIDEDAVCDDNNAVCDDNDAVCDDNDAVGFEEPLHNSYIDLYDFEKYWNEMIPNIPIAHNRVLQGGKYIKKMVEKDRYDQDDFIRSIANSEKINTFLEGNKKRPYALAHLWNRYWYEGFNGVVLRKLFDRPLLTRQILLSDWHFFKGIENRGEMVDADVKTSWAVGLLAISLGGISCFCIGNGFGFRKFF